MGIETALLAIATAATVGNVYASAQSSKAQRSAQERQRRQESLRAAVERRREIKAARQAAGLAAQAAETQGVADSSGAQGGQGSIVSQLNANLSFLDRQGMLADQAGAFLDKAARWESWANNLQGVQQLAFAAVPYAPQIEKALGMGAKTPTHTNRAGIQRMFRP